MADPIVIDPTLTLAGQAAAINAANTGLELEITHASFGRGHYDPTGDEVALVDPVGTHIPLAGGSRPTPYQLRMVCSWRENVGTVAIGEIGFWSNNILVFVWSKADGTLASYKTDGVTYVLFNDLVFAQVPANSINFVIDPNESAALAALAEHEAAANPHPQYILIANEATLAEMDDIGASNSTNWVSVRRLAGVMSSSLGSQDPLMAGAAEAGTELKSSREDHRHPTDTTRAPLDSPVFTGTPEAQTPAPFDSSTLLSTTEFVKRASGNYSGHLGLTGNTVLTPAAVGTVVVAEGGFTIALPAASASSDGGTIHFRNMGGGVVNVVCDGADLIVGGNGNLPSGIAMQPGATLELTSNGIGAWLAAGSAQLQYSKVDGVTPPLFDNSKALATTEFVTAQGVRFSDFHVFTGVLHGVAEHAGGLVQSHGADPSSYSLPDSVANNIPAGSTVRVNNWSNVPLGLAVQGGDVMQENIDGGWSAVTRSIPPDSYVDCTLFSTGSWLLTGTGVMGKTRPFGSLMDYNGFQILPSGTILQWGQTASALADTDMEQFLPIAFPNSFVGVLISQGYTMGSGSVGTAAAGPLTMGSFGWRGTAAGNGHHFLAIGN